MGQAQAWKTLQVVCTPQHHMQLLKQTMKLSLHAVVDQCGLSAACISSISKFMNNGSEISDPKISVVNTVTAHATNS